MRFQHVSIESVGYLLPEERLSSEQLEGRLAALYERLGFHPGRIELMSGIRERRVFPQGTKPSEISVAAGRDALAKTSIDPARIGLLIHSSVCRDFMEPATATVVHRALGLPHTCAAFDLSNACLGFGNAMLAAANMIELGQIEAALIVAGENGGPLLETTIERLNKDESISRKDSKLSFASLTIGSGGAAMVLARREQSNSGHRLLGGRMLVDSSANDLCSGGRNGDGDRAPLMKTDSEKLMCEGVKLAAQVWRETREELGWSNDAVDRVFTHQVGVMHRKLLFEKLELDPKLDFPTVETLGNIGSVSLPISMALGDECGVVSRGDKVALLGIGSGLVCLNLGVEW